jgi:hypothetical protein
MVDEKSGLLTKSSLTENIEKPVCIQFLEY